MKASELKEVIRLRIHHPRDYPPLFIWGGPGIGKTSITYQTAAEEGVRTIQTPPAVVTDPTDWRGIPIPKDGQAVWLPPKFLPSPDTTEPVVMFLDEINVAPPLVQNTLLQLLIPPYRLGDYTLPKTCSVFAAGNREMEAFVYRMSPPLLNRFEHVDLEVDNEEWSHWAVQNDVVPQVIGLVTKFRPELLYKFEPQKKAYPTPRTWEFVSKILKNGTNLPEHIKWEEIRGCVGEGASIELRAYQEIWTKLPDLDLIIEGKDSTIPQGVDLIYACCVGLVSKASKPSHFNHLLEYALKLEREYSVFLVKMLYAKNKESVTKSQKWTEFAKVLVVEDRIFS
jgi:hypothetical protein